MTEFRHNVFIQDVTELTKELVLEHSSKILQLTYATKEDNTLQHYTNIAIWKSYCKQVNELFPIRGSLEDKKAFMNGLVGKLKEKYPMNFPKYGWWDRKAAKQQR